MAEQSQALARFYDGYEQDGVSTDGLPNFREVLMVTLAVPPLTKIDRPATDEDIEQYPGPYKLYEKERLAKRPNGEVKGFPLVLWPACNGAELAMLAARDCYTVEQLAKYAERGGGSDTMPGELRELAQRAKKMVELSAEVGQFEAMIRDREGQITALQEQVGELRATIKAQDGQLNVLRARVA